MGSIESTMEDTSERSIASGEQPARQRQRRATESDVSGATSHDDPWWWEIENQDLILDQTAASESGGAGGGTRHDGELMLSEDFNTLLKIGENVNLTLAAGNNNNNDTSNIVTNEDNNNIAAKPTTAEETSTTCARESVRSANESASVSVSEKTDYPLTAASTTAGKQTALAREQEQSLEEFKEELRVKRLARQTAVQDLRDEITTLRKQLASEQALTRRLRNTDDIDDAEEDDNAANATLTVTLSNATDDIVDAASNDASAACSTGTCACLDADDVDPMSRGRHANIELANAQMELQLANADNLSLRTELGVVQKQVGTLKEVVACCKQMLSVKEEQCTQLKSKLQEIENTFGEHELKIMSAKLREEYERQLGNIRQLRQLYEERQRISAAEHENLQRLISIKKDELAAEQEKTKNFEERNQALMKEVENANNELAALREECNEHKFEKKALKEEMGAVNTLFSQMVMGFNGKNNLDIDRLTTMLEENRTLLNDMATKEINCSDGATLPKLLFELVEQAAVSGKCSRSPTPLIFTETEDDEDDADAEASESIAAAETAITDEPTPAHAEAATANEDTLANAKDLRQANTAEVAEQLGATALSFGSAASDNATKTTGKNVRKHQRKSSSNNKIKLYGATNNTNATCSSMNFDETEVIGKVASAQEIIGNLPKVWKVLMELLSHHKIEQVQFEENGSSEDCYKSVETANGPKAELSVSKTYIKLKDLILEKKALVKETNRLKTLNCHLDYRLNEQEKRLSAVSLELTKTWHLVGKMQRQHRQLHTQEQILRYQLQQKRRLLTELKDELEYCRRKWAAARAKNDESQEQCNDLRREFAKRKLEDANNSAESGYSDSGPASDEEERGGGGVVALAAAEEEVVAVAVQINAVAASVTHTSGSSASGGSNNNTNNCRRKFLKEMFEHTRKIKRMQSTSPGRAARDMANCESAEEPAEIVLRWNSAPPTCGWRDSSGGGGGGGLEEDYDEAEDEALAGEEAEGAGANQGAIPKGVAHSSRSKQRGRRVVEAMQEDVQNTVELGKGTEQRVDRANRIQRLEEQCKSLIQQVLETSDNRERLEVQLCRFQDEIAPVQYAVPLDEFINKKRVERMTRASSAPACGTLTPREEEYTRKRSERLERLEEESRQLMSRIKRTSDRGHYLRCSLDRIRRAPSHEGSCDSNAEEEPSKVEDVVRPTTINEGIATGALEAPETEAAQVDTTTETTTKSPLTPEEEEYTARRAARLQRLEAEGKQLLTQLTQNNERGNSLGGKMDDLHARYNPNETSTEPTADTPTSPTTIEQRIENIEKISTNREERLRLLEEEGKQLLTRLTNTSERGTRMINRIAERELSRQARLSATPSRDEGEDSNKEDTASASTDETPVAAALLPPLKNVACSSIVGEELTERVIVTTTPSQIAALQGAIPKSKPVAQLSAARPKPSKSVTPKTNADGESLEDMVKRLKQLPFPEQRTNDAGEVAKNEEVKEVMPESEVHNTETERENETKQNDHN